MVRLLEVLEPLSGLFPSAQPHLAVEVSMDQPHLFDLGRGYVRLGREWLSDPTQTKRALVMAVLKREQPVNSSNAFQLEVMTDFLMLAVMGETEWEGHSVANEVKFSTTSPSFAEYCKSPFRSIAHRGACAMEEVEASGPQVPVWGFRALLATALWKIYDHESMADKLETLRAIRHSAQPPRIAELHGNSIESKVQWFEKSLKDHVEALHLADRDGWQVKRTLKELEVESPTHWELTVDITHTPVWKEILEQFKAWSRLHPRERTLVFTPQGAVAFPAGLSVEWAADEVQSQKHVVIACHWPKPQDVLTVKSRHMFAQQSCAKVGEVFWN